MPERLDFQLADSSATEALGAALARAYRHLRSVSAVLYLYGELGAGKTTCVRALLRKFGIEGPIRSPTYTLVETYAVGSFVCVHVDLYRVRTPIEVDELGVREYFEGQCLLLVEWPDNGGAAVPPADVRLTLEYRDDARECSLHAVTPSGQRWLEYLARDTRLPPYVSNIT